MKKKTIYILSFISIFLFNQCETNKKSVELIHYKDSLQITNSDENLSIFLTKGSGFNHPTFVIWKEAYDGTYLQTLFITKSYASGIFGHAALSDSTWDNKPGESKQPAALPYWTYKKGLIDNVVSVPSKKHPYVDAYSGATPKGDFRFDTNIPSENKNYKILLEVNQTWDWNNYWTNNKYPESEAYKHSAQPSLIFAVTINESDSIYYMNPIGHGDARGQTGKLFTDISTISSAKKIFNTLKLIIQ